MEEWFVNCITLFINDFTINYMVVGENVIPKLDNNILPAMKFLLDLLNSWFLGQVKITTLFGLSSLGNISLMLLAYIPVKHMLITWEI